MVMDLSSKNVFNMSYPMVKQEQTSPQLQENNNQDVLDLCVKKRPKLDQEITINQTSEYFDSPHYSVTSSSPKSLNGSETSDSVNSDRMQDFNSFPGKAKVSRPFKAYPKDPVSLSLGVAPADFLFGKTSVDAYTEFRQKMLSQVQENNGTNKNMRRLSQNQTQQLDPHYLEKRRKNNEAAKRSRDARRAKEDEIAIRCAFLEQENLQLKFKLAALESESKRLFSMKMNC